MTEIRDLGASGLGVSSIVLGVVKSEPFQMRMSR